MSDPSTFRSAVEASDLERMIATFAEDAVLHSPITFKPFRRFVVYPAILRRLRVSWVATYPSRGGYDDAG